MGHMLNGLLKHYVLVIMVLEVQWRVVISAAAHTSCTELDSTKSLVELLRHQAGVLRKEYENTHFNENMNGSGSQIDDFTISGTNTAEKLQSIYTKDLLFYLHILKVKEYQAIWNNPKSVMEPLSRLNGTLFNLSAKIKHILNNSYPEITLLPTPPPLNLSHSHDYEKKMYGWHVIVSLVDWPTQVVQVIEEAKHMCDSRRSTLSTKMTSVDTVSTTIMSSAA